MRKLLFLDFDGVLNSWHHAVLNQKVVREPANTPDDADFQFGVAEIDPRNVQCLKYIADNVPGLEVVLSTSWRKSFAIETLKRILAHHGLTNDCVVGKTGVSETRADEIKHWMADNVTDGQKCKFAVLDDYKVLERDDPSMFGTDQITGLTMRDAFMVIEHLNPDFKRPVVLM